MISCLDVYNILDNVGGGGHHGGTRHKNVAILSPTVDRARKKGHKASPVGAVSVRRVRTVGLLIQPQPRVRREEI